MRALRILPARLPDLRLVERRDGFATRANLLDEAGSGRASDHQFAVGGALRYLPGVYGVHDGVPFRCRLRKID